jgi:hypothetical protein
MILETESQKARILWFLLFTTVNVYETRFKFISFLLAHFYKLVKKVMSLGLPTRLTYLQVLKDLSAKLYFKTILFGIITF